MYVEYHPTGLLRLRDVDNMRQFHVTVPEGKYATMVEALGSNGSGDTDGAHVWLSPDWIARLAGPVATPAWHDGFASMTDYARNKGWLDAEGRIRAHVETQAPQCEAHAASDFRRMMRRVPASVAVLATAKGDARVGLTVSSVASVTAEPPTLSVCVNQGSQSHAALSAADYVSLSFLGTEHVRIAGIFAGAGGVERHERFNHGDWRSGEAGQPLLTDAVSACECEVVSRFVIGSHTMLILTIRNIYGGSAQPIANIEGTLVPVG